MTFNTDTTHEHWKATDLSDEFQSVMATSQYDSKILQSSWNSCVNEPFDINHTHKTLRDAKDACRWHFFGGSPDKLLKSLHPRRASNIFTKEKSFLQFFKPEVLLGKRSSLFFAMGKGVMLHKGTKYTSRQSSSPRPVAISRLFVPRILAIIHTIVVVIVVIYVIGIIIVVEICKILGFGSRRSRFYAVIFHCRGYFYVFFFSFKFGTWNLFSEIGNNIKVCAMYLVTNVNVSMVTKL